MTAGPGRGKPRRNKRNTRDSAANRGSSGRPSARGGAARSLDRDGRNPTRPSGKQTSGKQTSGKQSSGARRKRPDGLDGTQVEGRHAVRELLLAGRRRTREIFIGNEVERTGIVSDIVELAGELRVPVRAVGHTKLDHMARTEAPQGVVAIAQALPTEELSSLCRPIGGRNPFLLALDGVTDPGNLGAVLRVAECAGVTGVVLPRHRAAHVTPAVTKAAAGAVEHLPMSLVGGLPAALQQMRSDGVWTVGLDAAGETAIHELVVADEPVCLVLGAEGSGLSRLVSQRCDLLASIPLHGRLASLNVASAAAVACYEVARRRH